MDRWLLRLFLGLVLLGCFPRMAAAHGDLHERIDEATAAIAREPANGALYLKRGSLYLEHEQFEPALADFARAAALEPGAPDLDLLRARALLRSGSAEDALAAAARHLKQRPDDAEGLLVQARSLAVLRRFRESVAAYDAAVQHLPRLSPDYCLERARAAEAMGAGGRAEALRGLDRGLAQLGPLVALQQEAIDLEVRAGNWDGALARVEQILARGGRNETWLLRKAEVLAQAGRRRDALTACDATEAVVQALPERIRRTPACEETLGRVRALRSRLTEGAGP